DLDNMDFSVPKITLDGLNLQLKQGIAEEIAENAVKVADTVAKSPAIKIKLEEIDLSKITVVYNNEGSKLNTGLTLGKLLLKFNDIDLEKQVVDISKIEFKDTKGELKFGKIIQQ